MLQQREKSLSWGLSHHTHVYISLRPFCTHVERSSFSLDKFLPPLVRVGKLQKGSTFQPMQTTPTMSEMCDLQIHINGQQTFFLSERIMCKYSGKLRKIIKQEKRRTQIRSSGIEIDDFPGGSDGFEQVSRFCYNNRNISISVSNVSLLHCCAVFLGMSEKVSQVNLLHQTEIFLEGIFYWSWNEILICLKNCEPFICYAESCGLIQKLICSLLAKIAQKSDVNFPSVSSSSSSSSPETARSLSSPALLQSSSSRKVCSWWFQDMTILSPRIIEQFLRGLGSCGSDNTNLIITRFLLHYLKTAHHSDGNNTVYAFTEYAGLADTAVHGVVLIGKTAFSCRGLFWVLRIASGYGLSRELRAQLERLIGGMLDQATLDDLLVSKGVNGEVYDVNLILRLIRLYVHYHKKPLSDKMNNVGKLIDMYLREIGPDPNLKISKFLGVAESLPDCARDSFDQVYRAIDIYLESHPSLSLEERSRLCRCLNYEKLSLEACKDLAKNPRIPPRIAVQALASQHPNIQTVQLLKYDVYEDTSHNNYNKSISNSNCNQLVLYKGDDNSNKLESESSAGEEKEDVNLNLEKMQWRVIELEKVCIEMKGQMARMAKLGPQHNWILPRMC